MTPYYSDDAVTLYHGDALEVMQSWAPAAVDAIVTSPEYADQRRYAHGAKTRPDAFADHLSPFLGEMLRVLRPTGSLMLNLGVILRDGEETPYADEVLQAARKQGWKLLHRMVWHKKNPIPLSHPDYLTVAHEWVFWLAPTTKVYRGYDSDTRTPHAAATLRRIGEPYLTSKDERYRKRGKTHELHPLGAKPTTVYSSAVGSTRGIKHPAPMALNLARQLVSLSCPPDGLVLDPFCGSGATLVAAIERGRRAQGIDITSDYLDEAIERITVAEQRGVQGGFDFGGAA